MKTSNKLLVGTVICIILGIFSYAFVMRGAYQKALANPLANELRIDLKAMKYLNLSYGSYVTFKRGDKYEATLNVKSGTNKMIVSEQKMIFKDTEGAGKEVALRLFGKGGSLVFDPVVVN